MQPTQLTIKLKHTLVLNKVAYIFVQFMLHVWVQPVMSGLTEHEGLNLRDIRWQNGVS